MKPDNIYNQLKKLLEDTGGKYNILEEQIDIDLQLEFFDLVNKLLEDKKGEIKILDLEENLYNDAVPDDDKKKILAELSISEDPKAYRIIEKFVETKPDDIYSWSVLSLQHSRISLETHMLGEQQVFISTGLGGKDEKLRYFIVCKFKEDQEITQSQKKLLQMEFEEAFKKNNSIIEMFKYFQSYVSILGLIPIETPINTIVKSAINESNNYGDFIYDKFLVTNVKVLEINEIEGHFKKMGI